MRYVIVSLSCVVPALLSSLATAQTSPAQPSPRPASVSVSALTLQDVGPWGAAALPEGMAPISSDLWRGADPGTLAVAFGKLSADQRFPSLQVLARQAVFSGGAAPTTDPDIARTRFEAANRLGPADAASRLISGVPRLTSDAGLATLAIDAGLRVGRIEEACGLIETIPVAAQGITWLESRATCYALNDEAAAANLSVDLAKARGQTDTWLSRAVAAVAGPLSAPPPFRVDSGRAVALSLRAKLKPPLNFTSTHDAAALSALVNNTTFLETLAPDERQTLLANAAARGVIPASRAARPLLAPAAPPADPSQPVLDVPAVPAQLTARMLAATSLQARSVEARIAVNELRAIMTAQPGLLTLSDVPVMVEAALWAGDGALARAVADLSPDALDPKLALVLALYEPNRQPILIEQMLDRAGTDPVARRLALRDGVIAWSAGVPVGGGLSNLIQQGLPWGQAGQVGPRIALDFASQRGSKGEVALLTALALQGEDPANVNPETLIIAVRSLRRVGLESAARDLARDYLLATSVTLAATRQAPRPRAASTPAPASRQQSAPTSAPAAATRPPVARPTPTPAPPPAARPAPRRPAAAPSPPPSPPPATPRAKPSWGTP
jgi:hypothetical protein